MHIYLFISNQKHQIVVTFEEIHGSIISIAY